jgi:hypothetical protein
MKKIIIGLSGLVVLTFAVVLFVSAQNNSQEVKKAATEVSKDCAKCPSASTCTKMSENKTAVSDTAKCKVSKCDMTKCKEGKMDPAACKAKCTEAKSEMKSCDPANCKTACPMKSAEKTK